MCRINKCLCFILSICCLASCNPDKRVKSTGQAPGRLIDSVIRRAESLKYTSPDSAAVVYGVLSGLCREGGFDSIRMDCYKSLTEIYCVVRQDKKMGELYADSAMQLGVANNSLYPKACYIRGNYYSAISQNDSAIHYFLQGLAAAATRTHTDSAFELNTYGRLSLIYFKQRNNEAAMRYYRPLIRQAEQRMNSINDVFTFINAYCYSTKEYSETELNGDSAGYYLMTAKALSAKLKDSCYNAILFTNLANYYFNEKQKDSCIFYSRLAISAIRKKQMGYERLENPYSLLISQYLQTGQYTQAEAALDSLLAEVPLEKMEADRQAACYGYQYAISRHKHDETAALQALEKQHALQETLYKTYKADQLLEHEKTIRRLSAEKTIAKKNAEIRRQKIYTYLLFSMIIGLLLLVVNVYLVVQKRRKILAVKVKLQKKQAQLEKDRAILQQKIEERNRIAQEMHDDLGSTLTTVQMGISLLEMDPANPVYLDVINQSTQKLGHQINEVIWNLNMRNDYLFSLVDYFRHYARAFLGNAGIALQLQCLAEEDIPVPGHMRRGIYLTLKELMNNIVKYSEARTVSIHIEEKEGQLHIRVKDDGIGMENSRQKYAGGGHNGLANMQETITALGGTITWQDNRGTETIIHLPL